MNIKKKQIIRLIIRQTDNLQSDLKKSAFRLKSHWFRDL